MDELRYNHRYWFIIKYPWEEEEILIRATFIRLDYAVFPEEDYLHLNTYQLQDGLTQQGSLSMPYQWVQNYVTLRQTIPHIKLPDDILYSINSFL